MFGDAGATYAFIVVGAALRALCLPVGSAKIPGRGAPARGRHRSRAFGDAGARGLLEALQVIGTDWPTSTEPEKALGGRRL